MGTFICYLVNHKNIVFQLEAFTLKALNFKSVNFLPLKQQSKVNKYPSLFLLVISSSRYHPLSYIVSLSELGASPLS